MFFKDFFTSFLAIAVSKIKYLNFSGNESFKQNQKRLKAIQKFLIF